MYKECKNPRCHKLVRSTYCDEHQQSVSKYYNSARRNDKETKFYQSQEWRDKSKEIMKRDCFMCVYCSADAQLVHHKTELRQDFSLRLDNNNLESVCKACHNKIHNIRNK